jgi:hypothetical protein
VGDAVGDVLGDSVVDSVGDSVADTVGDALSSSSTPSSPASWRSKLSLLPVRSVSAASTLVESDLLFFPKLSKRKLPNPPFPLIFFDLKNRRPAFPLPALLLPALPLPFAHLGSLVRLEHPLDFSALAASPVAEAIAVKLGPTLDNRVGDRVTGPPVGVEVGIGVGDVVGDVVGDAVGGDVGDAVGDAVGDLVGDSVGNAVWDAVSDAVGDTVGDAVGDTVGDAVGGTNDWLDGRLVVDEVDDKVDDNEVVVDDHVVGDPVGSSAGKRAEKDTGEGVTGEAGELFDPFEEEATVSTSGFKTRWPFLDAVLDRRSIRTGIWSSCSSTFGSYMSLVPCFVSTAIVDEADHDCNNKGMTINFVIFIVVVVVIFFVSSSLLTVRQSECSCSSNGGINSFDHRVMEINELWL